MFRVVHKRPEEVFYHSTQVLDFHEGKTTDAAVLFPADKGEFVTSSDAGFFPYIFWEHHLSAIVNAQYCFHLIPGDGVHPQGELPGVHIELSIIFLTMRILKIFLIFLHIVLFRKIKFVCYLYEAQNIVTNPGPGSPRPFNYSPANIPSTV